MSIFIAVMPVLLGFLIDMIFGDPYNFPHPIRLIGTLISGLENLMRRRLPNKPFAGGALLAVIVLLTSAVIPAIVLLVCYRISVILGIVAESVMCWYIIAAKCLKTESIKVYSALEVNDTERARTDLSMIVGRDTAVLDDNGIIRAAVETVAENASDGVTAPLIFIMLGGAPLGFFYKAANTMDSMLGYKNEKYLEFGRFAAKLDDVLNFIPSRVSALIMILAAFILHYDGKAAYRIWRRDRLKHASPNSAQTESVCAGALGIRLGGDAYYFGKLCKKEYIGDDLRSPKNADIVCANRLMYLTSAIVLLIAVLFRAVVFGGML